MLRVATALLAGVGALSVAQAEETDRALKAFARPAVTAKRGEPVLPLEWEQRLRSSDHFGPPLLRADDAAFLAAARDERWSEALALLKSGRASANAQDDMRGNALVLAARAGQDVLVRELLRRGANAERWGEDGFTPLGAASFAGHRSTVRVLLRGGVDPARHGATGQTALHLASVAGRTDVLEVLLRAGIHIELLNSHRESALDVAASAGQEAAMDLLIKAGADLQLAGRR